MLSDSFSSFLFTFPNISMHFEWWTYSFLHFEMIFKSSFEQMWCVHHVAEYETYDIWISKYLQCGCVACLTHYTIDAILSHRSFRNHHQVGLDAPLPQVVTAVTTIPWFHIKLTMKTLHGALWDVDATGPHIQRGQRLDRSLIYQLPWKCFCRLHGSVNHFLIIWKYGILLLYTNTQIPLDEFTIFLKQVNEHPCSIILSCFELVAL